MDAEQVKALAVAAMMSVLQGAKAWTFSLVDHCGDVEAQHAVLVQAKNDTAEAKKQLMDGIDAMQAQIDSLRMDAERMRSALDDSVAEVERLTKLVEFASKYGFGQVDAALSEESKGTT